MNRDTAALQQPGEKQVDTPFPPNHLRQHSVLLLPATQHRGQGEKATKLAPLNKQDLYFASQAEQMPLKTFRDHLRGQERWSLAMGVCTAKGDGETQALVSLPAPHAAAACSGHKLHKCTVPFTAAALRWHSSESRHARKHLDQVMKGVGDS